MRRPFDRAVEKVTGGYAGILRRIVTRRMLTLAVVGGLCRRHRRRQHAAPDRVSSRARTRASSTAIIQTPPGSTLEYTNAKSHELQAIAKELEEVTSVTSLAGYEVLTEGRGSNAGTCIINLKNWSDRKRTARQIIEELEEKCRKMTNVKLEFFEPPAVPGFGAAGGFSVRLLDKTNTTDYQRLGEVTDKFMAALAKRKELKDLFTFYASRLPAVRADHRQRRGHAEGRVDREGAGQPLHPHRQHLRARLRPLRPVLQGLRPGRRRSSGGSPRIWTTCSSRTTAGKWSPTPRS